ncbi:MAG: hypothetical protein AAFX85_18170, partial [Pseudomonadota bacterium]
MSESAEESVRVGNASGRNSPGTRPGALASPTGVLASPLVTARWLTSALAGTRGDLVALLGGAPLPLAFAPFGWWLLAPCMLALLFATWLGVTPRRAAWRGFLFGSAGFLAGTYIAFQLAFPELNWGLSYTSFGRL